MTPYVLDPDRALFDSAEIEQVIAERDAANAASVRALLSSADMLTMIASVLGMRPPDLSKAAILAELARVAPEIAALRRIEAEGFDVQRYDRGRWEIQHPGERGYYFGSTLAEALANFDRTKRGT